MALLVILLAHIANTYQIYIYICVWILDIQLPHFYSRRARSGGFSP